MKSPCLKILLSLILLLFVSENVVSQNVGTWKTYMAYHDATMVVETNSLVFAVYDGSLLSYDPEYDEVITYGFEHGLSDVEISLIKYSPDDNALIIIYRNCNIDIFYGIHDVVNMPFIKNDAIENKEIYAIDIIDDYVYLSAGFGIVVLDLKRSVIKETYTLGAPIRAVCKLDDYLYAATDNGFKRCLFSVNLMDKENWIALDKNEMDYPGTYQNIRKLFLYKGQWVIQETGKMYYRDNDGTVKEFWSGAVRHTTVINDLLVASYYDVIYFYTDFSNNYKRIPYTAYYVDSYNSPDKYWLACGDAGIIQISMDISSSDSQELVSDILINSPGSNTINYITYTQDKLLITGGGKSADRFKNPGILMVLDDNNWFNFDSKEIEQQIGMEEGRCRDFMSVVVDPADRNHYFVSSWGEGVYEFQDNVCINRFTEGNSSLKSARGNGQWYVRVDGMAFDQNGDLYVVSDEVENTVSVFSAARQWKSYYYQPFADEHIKDVFVDRNNRKWFNKNRTKGQGIGIMVLDDDGNYYYSNRFIDRQGETVTASAFLCTAEDKNGYIWVGTDNGPIRFSGPEDIYNGRCDRLIGTDEYGEYYRILEGVRITTLAIDGGGRKWMGTDGSGMYMLDDTGSEPYVENFTTNNSLLISDNIISIAINDRNGEIFVGTDKGLMSYQSDAVEGSPDYSDVYAYPNPVYPDRQTGGVIITGLMGDSSIKITDLAGNLMVQGTSIGGMYRWNCTNNSGDTVKSGIYLVFAAQSDGSTGVVTKIMVIR